jgi:hypothetical protein
MVDAIRQDATGGLGPSCERFEEMCGVKKGERVSSTSCASASRRRAARIERRQGRRKSRTQAALVNDVRGSIDEVSWCRRNQ